MGKKATFNGMKKRRYFKLTLTVYSWVNFIATDEDGFCIGYEEEPTMANYLPIMPVGHWRSRMNRHELGRINLDGVHWTESLMRVK